MLKIWGRLMKNDKIIKDAVVSSDLDASYQENLKACIVELCHEFDISIPYWLPPNVKEYNNRRKTIFNENHFIDEINFDKFIIQEIDMEN
ncbi:MAG: hypothetical protein PHX70_10995 [Clostridium sp.]|nr:hypothetical protein [Clostridium sp.]